MTTTVPPNFVASGGNLAPRCDRKPCQLAGDGTGGFTCPCYEGDRPLWHSRGSAA